MSDRGGTSDIYLMDSTGTILNGVTADAAQEAYLSWSPDGSKLVFQRDAGGDNGIYAVNSDHTTVRNSTIRVSQADAITLDNSRYGHIHENRLSLNNGAAVAVLSGSHGTEVYGHRDIGGSGNVIDASDGLPSGASGSNGNTSPTGAPGPKTIFVTSDGHNGDLGGTSGANSICQSRADAGVVPEGEYVALLSSPSANGSARLNASGGPYLTSTGLVIAGGLEGLFERMRRAEATLDDVASAYSTWVYRREGSFARAGEVLGVDRRTVSKHVGEADAQEK